MSKNRSSLITWAVVVGLLLFAAIASAVSGNLSLPSPSLGEGGIELGGGGISLPLPESETAAISLDFLPIPGLNELSLNPYLAMLILGALFAGPIVIGGATLAFLVRLADRRVEGVKSSEAYTGAVQTLEARDKELLKSYKAAQPANPIPSHERPRWSAASSMMLFALFAIFLGFALANTFVEGGVVQQGDELTSVNSIVIWLLLAGALLFGLVFLRPQSMARVDGSDQLPIPWGMVWSIIAGVIILGLGSGLIVFLRNAG